MKIQVEKMISYTIDPSIFIPPKIPTNNDLLIKYKEQLKYFFNIINKCYEYIHLEEISVYIFHGYSSSYNLTLRKSNIMSAFPQLMKFS